MQKSNDLNTCFIVEASDAGERIDKLLARRLPDVGRRFAQDLCAQGAVRQNGHRCKKSDLALADAQIEVQGHHFGHAQPAPHIPLDVVFENEHLVIVNKAPGIPCAALIGKEENTLAGAMLARYPEMADVGFGPREPGLLHRLDNYTSGLVLFARTQTAFSALHQAMSAKQIVKKYLALVPSGILEEEGVCELALYTKKDSPQRVLVAEEGGHACRTEFRRLSQAEYELFEVQVRAAYRHQIRAHFAALGAPLLGDERYGSQLLSSAPRHALHASYIAGATEETGEFSASCTLPADLTALLEPRR